MKRNIFVLLFVITGLAGLLTILQLKDILKIYRISTSAMMPTFRKGTFTLASSLKKPAVGNMILFKHSYYKGPDTVNRTCISRLMGREGDTIEINDGFILRNRMIADIPANLMFTYSVNQQVVFHQPIFEHLLVYPILKHDTVFCTLTCEEYKKLSRAFKLHKFVQADNQLLKLVYYIMHTKSGLTSNGNPFVIPKGYGFVFADNRGEDFQPPYFGLVLLTDIESTVIF